MINAYDRLAFAQFQPYSLQEMMIPAQYLRQQEDQMAEDLNQQQLLNAAAKSQLIKGVDDAELAQAQAIDQQINTLATDLAKNGFNAIGRRTGLNKLRTEYNNTILPIQQSAANRAKLAEFQQQALLKDPSIKFNRMAFDISVREGVDNPQVYSQILGISGNQLAQQVSQQAAPFAKVLAQVAPQTLAIKDPNGRPIAFQYMQMMQRGATPEEIASVMSGRDGIAPEAATKLAVTLKGVVDNVVQSAGVYDIFGDSDTSAELWQAAANGITSALGSPEIRNITDSYGMQMAVEAQKQRRAAAAAKAKAASMLYPYLSNIDNVKLSPEQAKAWSKLNKIAKSGDAAGLSNIKAALAMPSEATLRREAQELMRQDSFYRGSEKGFTLNRSNLSEDQAYQRVVNKYKTKQDALRKELITLGLDPDNLTEENFTEMWNNSKNGIATLNKVYNINPESDPQIYKRLESEIYRRSNSGVLLKDEEGEYIGSATGDGTFNNNIDIFDKNGKLKIGYSFQIRPGSGLGILNEKSGEFYTIDPSQIDNNITRDISTIRSFGINPNSAEYKAIKDAYIEAASYQVTPEMLANMGYRGSYEQALSEYADSLIAREYSNAARTAVSALSVKNEPINVDAK